MSELDPRAIFYNIRHQLDKQKNYALNIGDLASKPYLALVPDLQDRVVLDAGMGNGWMAGLFLDRRPAFLHGVDIAPDRVADVEAAYADRPAPHRFYAQGLDALPFLEDASVDFINCRDVIEHVPDPAATLAEFRRVLRPGGHLLLQTPNNLYHGILSVGYWMSGVLQYLFAGQVAAWQHDPFLMQDSTALSAEQQDAYATIAEAQIQEHEQVWTPTEFLDFLRAGGFDEFVLDGTPILAAVFYQNGRLMPAFSDFYCQLVDSPLYTVMLEAIRADLIAGGRIDAALAELAVQYVLSDDLIVRVTR